MFVTTALGTASLISAAQAQTAPAGTSASNAETVETVIVTAEKTTRSSVVIGGAETQKILPGLSPLKAIDTLPGVVYETADPWGNNEQNESLIVHGFTPSNSATPWTASRWAISNTAITTA